MDETIRYSRYAFYVNPLFKITEIDIYKVVKLDFLWSIALIRYLTEYLAFV